MDKVQRASIVIRMIRRILFNMPERKYVTAGDRACREMIRAPRRRRRADPSDDSILAWAMFDLTKEMIEGFWDQRASRPVPTGCAVF